MEKYIPNANVITTRNREKWVSVVQKVHNWIYSWMRPGYVEDNSEYCISKNLLIKFICSAPVLAAAEGNQFMIVAILKFLREHVFT
jgi:hypothetical protein